MDSVTKQIDALSEFPSFANNNEYMMVIGKEKEFEEIRKKIISEVQSACSHDFISKYKDSKSIFDPKILESKTCKHCGFQPEKPKGSEYKICESCWNEMKFLENRRSGEDSLSVYKCTVCNHEASHT